MRGRALIMDDSGILSLQLQQVLQQLGLSVVMLRANQKTPDAEVIFVELVQQQFNGFQCLRHLRQETRSLLVLVSGSARSSDRHWAMQAGAAAVIQRPVNKQVVGAALKAAGFGANTSGHENVAPAVSRGDGVQQ